MRQKAHLSTWVLAEMGQIDRRRRRRGCAQTSAVYFLHRGLDKPFSIDGGILFLGNASSNPFVVARFIGPRTREKETARKGRQFPFSGDEFIACPPPTLPAPSALPTALAPRSAASL